MKIEWVFLFSFGWTKLNIEKKFYIRFRGKLKRTLSEEIQKNKKIFFLISFAKIFKIIIIKAPKIIAENFMRLAWYEQIF